MIPSSPVVVKRLLQPHQRLVWLLALVALLSFVSVWMGIDQPWYIVILAWPLLDLLRVSQFPPPSVQRQLPGHLPLNRTASVTLSLDWWPAGPNAASVQAKFQAEVTDDVPGGQPAQRQHVQLQPGARHQLTYTLCPRRRGPLQLKHCWVRIRSPFGFWWRGWQLQVVTSTRVYPDFTKVESYRLMAMDQHRNQMGIHLRQKRGEGSDFLQLRDYREGDGLRQIDWNATARRHRLISREYQEDRDQQLVLMLDSGRRMLAEDEELTFFDRCLNGLLMLSYAALRQGDSVAMMSFADQQRLLPAVKGSAALNRLLNHFYDLYPTAQASDYLAAAATLTERFPKRALVVIATTLRDSDTAEILAAWHLLSRKHFVVLANLREPALDAVLHHPVGDFAEARHFIGVHTLLRQREQIQTRLRAEGMIVLDCTPIALSAMLINTYLAIKSSGYL